MATAALKRRVARAEAAAKKSQGKMLANVNAAPLPPPPPTPLEIQTARRQAAELALSKMIASVQLGNDSMDVVGKSLCKLLKDPSITPSMQVALDVVVGALAETRMVYHRAVSSSSVVAILPAQTAMNPKF